MHYNHSFCDDDACVCSHFACIMLNVVEYVAHYFSMSDFRYFDNKFEEALNLTKQSKPIQIMNRRQDIEEDEDQDIEGRIQELEINMNSLVNGQDSLRSDVGNISQQLAQLTSLIERGQSNLRSLQRQDDDDNMSVSSQVSNMSSPPSHLHNTGKMCFVNCEAHYGWFIVYKKKEHQKTMYTYRNGELRSLSSAQIKSLKDVNEQESLLGRV